MDPATRHGLARQLATLDVRAASLPPSAILFVRRLADPRPRTIDAADPRPWPPEAWTRALGEAVDRAGRRALRPAAGPVAASADAVVFLDPAELLACLARDLLAGDVTANWWWQAWLRATGRSTLDLVLDAWVREARHIPPALAALHDRGLAAPFAAALQPREARTLFVAMTDAYDLPALAAPTPAADLPIVSPAARPPRQAARARAHAPPDRAEGRAPERPPPAPPWGPIVSGPPVPATLGLEQRTLLGVALVLSRAPLVARTEGFRRAFHAWRRAEQFAPPASAPAKPPAVEHAVAHPARAVDDVDRAGATTGGIEPSVRRSSAEASVAPAAELEQVAGGPTDTPSEPLDVARLAAVAASAQRHADGVAATDWPSDTPALPALPGADAGSDASWFETRSTSDPRGAPASTRAAEAAPAVVRKPAVAASPSNLRAESVRTRLGGVLFLVNALLQLELFDRLDDHFGVDSSIGGWGWLEMLARGLLGHGRVAAAGDPIWHALGALDGRAPDARVPETCGVSGALHLPEAWPAPAATATPPRRLRRRRPLGLAPSGDLRNLLALLVPYLRWRLSSAMALDAASPPGEDALLATRLLARDGRLTWTATHVDLHMDLDQIDIAVRLAGLDANPGWVPALGRVVTFSFDRSGA